MNRRHFLSLLAPLALAACGDGAAPFGAPSADPESSIPPDEDTDLGEPSEEERARFASRSNALGFDLYAKVARPGANVALSPFSIATALTMTWAGARGETESQLRKVLHLQGAREQILSDAGKVSAWLRSKDRPFTLRGANRLPDASRVEINRWVEQRTEKRIKDLLPDGSIDELTRLVLVNALYFLADWAAPFEKERTYDAAFTTASAGVKQVATMHESASFKLAQREGVKLLELPYEGNSMSMLLVLPDAVDGLPALESSLTPDTLRELRAAARPTLVDVAIPKFEIDPPGSMALGSALQELGMKQAFTRQADFTGIADPPNPDERLFVSAVFHKAFVKVDEKGTEAAAATAVVMAETASAQPAPAATFTADHPFLFFIVDDASSLVLFMGRVADPGAK